MNAAEVSSALGRPLEVVTPLGGGYANATYAVSGPGLSAVLRAFLRDPTRRDMEVALLSRVAPAVPVPEVLWSGEVQGRPALLISRVDGVLVDAVLHGGTVTDMTSAAQAVGRTLAAVHEIAFDRTGFLDDHLEPVGDAGMSPGDLRAYARRHLYDGDAGAVLGDRLRDQWWSLIDGAADILSRVDGQARLVHADYNGKNMLVRRAGDRWSVAAVLDWEFAFVGPPLVDVANMLRFPAPDGFAAAFTDGYRGADGELPNDWQPIAASLDVFALLGLLRPGGTLVDRVVELVRTQVARGHL